LLVGALLIFAALYVPGELSEAEVASAVSSSHIAPNQFDPSTVIDLPYALLQRISFAVFGVTTLSIKLPSLLLGLMSVVGIVLLLRQWFHENVAIIATLIIITTSQFIFASQDGTPTIMYIFLPTWLLLLAMKASRQLGRRNFWEFLLMAALALSLYTPLSIYIILALFSSTLLHPHLRFIVGRLSKQKLIIAGMMGMILLAPLVTALAMEPKLGLTLLGIPSSQPDFIANAKTLVHSYLDFVPAGTNDNIRAIYALPALLLVLLGLTKLVTTNYTARSYIITSWAVLLIPVILINPEKTAITFVPVMLLVASGIDVLLYRWYRLFPRNPYARVAGLLPITILIGGMAFTGIERYFYTYHYDPAVVSKYSNDLKSLETELADITRASQPVTVFVGESEQPFYQAVVKYKSNVSLISSNQPTPKERPLIATRSAVQSHDLGEPTKIIVNERSNESDRLYLYKTAAE
jgi:hypothetical protein